jgi:hypothetical protein
MIGSHVMVFLRGSDVVTRQGPRRREEELWPRSFSGASVLTASSSIHLDDNLYYANCITNVAWRSNDDCENVGCAGASRGATPGFRQKPAKILLASSLIPRIVQVDSHSRPELHSHEHFTLCPKYDFQPPGCCQVAETLPIKVPFDGIA